LEEEEMDEMSEPRLRRDDPDRTEPNRSFSGTFQPDAAGGEDFVTRGVRMGYRLIEEQMRRGQQVAQDAGTRFGTSRSGDLRDLAERALRFYSDLYTDAALFWLDAATAMTAPVDPATPDKSSSFTAPTASLAVPMDIASSRPTRVTLNVQPGVRGASLQVLTMRATDPSKPPLMDVSFQPGGELPVLRIRVPNEQPADVYHGVVCDQQSGAVLGTLSVEIRES
jgi:hypothetical protein